MAESGYNSARDSLIVSPLQNQWRDAIIALQRVLYCQICLIIRCRNLHIRHLSNQKPRMRREIVYFALLACICGAPVDSHDAEARSLNVHLI